MDALSGERRRFDVYGRFRIEVVREGERWVVYRLGAGTRRLDETVTLPDAVSAADLPGVLDDLLHEYARPGHALRPLED